MADPEEVPVTENPGAVAPPRAEPVSLESPLPEAVSAEAVPAEALRPESAPPPSGSTNGARLRWAARLKAILGAEAFAPAVVVAVSMLVLGGLFGFFAFPYAVDGNFDEGVEAAVVERMIDGRGLPYVDGFAHRGPFLYWTQAVFHLVFGRFDWLPLRMMSITCGLLTMLLTFVAAWAAGRPLAGAMGAVLHVFVIATVYDTTGAGVTAEHPATMYLTASFALVGIGVHRVTSHRRAAWLFAAAGVVLAMATLTKQTLAIAVIPLLMWLVLGAFREPTKTWGARFLWSFLPFVAGGLAMVGLVFARYAGAGEFKTFWFHFYTFNATSYLGDSSNRLHQMADWWFREPLAILGVAAGFSLALGAPVAHLEAWTRAGVRNALGAATYEVVLGLSLLFLMIAVGYPLRGWPHYFVPLWGVLGTVFGLGLEGFFARSATAGRAVAALIVTVVLVIVAIHRYDNLRERRARNEWPDPRGEKVCKEIDRIAGPSPRAIYAWGWLGDVYVNCRRRSASMFTYATPLAGVVPPNWSQPDPKNVPPGSRERLIQELTDDQTPLIIDTRLDGSMRMMDIPLLAAFVEERYCKSSVVRDSRNRELTLYALKGTPFCAPP